MFIGIETIHYVRLVQARVDRVIKSYKGRQGFGCFLFNFFFSQSYLILSCLHERLKAFT